MDNNFTEQQLISQLLFIQKTKHQSRQVTSSLQSAAVLVIVDFNNIEDPTILITQRSLNLRHHPGQFCFPGGKPEMNVDETLLDTALRETQEEIGLSPKHFKHYFELNNFTTLSGFSITPFLTTLNNPYTLNLNVNEVRKVFSMPLKYILVPQNIFKMKINKSNRDVYAFSYKGKLVWGATAGILIDLACRLSIKDPADYLSQIRRFI